VEFVIPSAARSARVTILSPAEELYQPLMHGFDCGRLAGLGIAQGPNLALQHGIPGLPQTGNRTTKHHRQDCACRACRNRLRQQHRIISPHNGFLTAEHIIDERGFGHMGKPYRIRGPSRRPRHVYRFEYGVVHFSYFADQNSVGDICRRTEADGDIGIPFLETDIRRFSFNVDSNPWSLLTNEGSRRPGPEQVAQG
jgi:hypothetical protein